MEREDPQWTPVFSWKEMCLQYPFRLPVSRWSFRQKSMSKAFSILMLNLGLRTDSSLSSWLKRKEKTNHLQIQDRTWSSLDALQNNTILIWKWTQARTLVSYLYKWLMLIIVLWRETTLVLEKWATVSGSSIFPFRGPREKCSPILSRAGGLRHSLYLSYLPRTSRSSMSGTSESRKNFQLLFFLHLHFLLNFIASRNPY